MRVLISIDDTDNIGSRGTGALASMISETIEAKGWGKCSYVTRHQLYVHPDVPYTSHNSSMCFEAEIDEGHLADVKKHVCVFLERESAEGSDPGFCMAARDRIPDPLRLVEFGKRAKTGIVTKGDAYSLALEMGIHLSEHGGTGQGIIGALAGAGLRLGGNDGRVKGKIRLEVQGSTATAGDIRSRFGIERIADISGADIRDDETIEMGEELKAVFLANKKTLLVFPGIKGEDGRTVWHTYSKQQLKIY